MQGSEIVLGDANRMTSSKPLAGSRGRGWCPFAALVLVLVSSCAADPSFSSEPGRSSTIRLSEPASPTHTGSPAPSHVPGTDPVAAHIVQVVADGLQVRSAAGTGAEVVGGLERGAVARIESEPVESDGFVWYEVVDLDSKRGWVASGDDEDSWLAPLSFTVSMAIGTGPAPPGTLRVDAGVVPRAASLGDLEDLPPEGACAEVGIADAFELARVLRGSESRLELDIYSFTTFSTDAGWFSASVSPRAPDGFPGCADMGS